MQHPQQHEDNGNNSSNNDLKKKHDDDLLKHNNGNGDDEEILFTDDDDFNVRRPIITDDSGDDNGNDHQHQEQDLEEVPLFSGGGAFATASSPLRITTAATVTSSGTTSLPNNITTSFSSPLVSSSSSSSSSSAVQQRRNNNSNTTPTRSNKNKINSISSSNSRSTTTTTTPSAVLKSADFRLQQQTRLGNTPQQRPTQQQQHVLSTFDPYKSPRGRGAAAAQATAIVASSLLDSSMEDEEEEEDVHGGSVALLSMSSSRHHGEEEAVFLEMETASMDYGDDHHHHDHQYPPIQLQGSNSSGSGSGSMQKQNNYYYYYAPGDPIKTSSGLLLTHRRTPVPSSPIPAVAAVTGHTPLFPHGTGGSNSSANPMRLHAPNQQGQQQQQQQQYYGGNSSFSAFPNGNNPNNNNTAAGKTQSSWSSSSGMVRRFEVENPWNNNSNSSHGGNNGDSFLRQAQRMLSFVRIWVVLSAIILLVGTAIVLHHLRRASHESISSTTTTRISSSSSPLFQIQQQQDGSRLVVPVMNNGNMQQQQQQQQLSYNYANAFPGGESTTDRVVLLPLSPEMIQQQQQEQQRKNNNINQHNHHHRIPGHGRRRVLKELRNEFEDWIRHHDKRYHSHQEKEERFFIWAQNHERTLQKNQQHGPCKLTGQAVFGSNHFKDLTPSEFQDLYLNSKKPRPREEERQQQQQQQRRAATASVLKPPPPVESINAMSEESLSTQPVHHPEVHRRIQELWDRPRVKSTTRSGSSSNSKKFNCSWWDVSCILQYIFEKFVYGFYGIGTTMEPAYDADSYPTAVDWRDVGAVTEVRTQDGCGACWAITAVETVESANFLSYGVLYDLSETEVIVCTSDCEMCDGGWPEEAFDYIIDHNGVPLSKDMSYDGNWLLAVSNSRSGASDALDSSTVKAYMSATCPNYGGGGGNSKSGSGSQDRNNNYDYGGNDDASNGFTQNTYSRYGTIKGYGYATERCVCYTDGTGCDCDDQDEGLAVGNLATYGPAVVCIDASDWQDYGGGIITSSSGCSAKFLDVNHCVQVVGYAFASDQGNDESGNNQNGGNSHSGSGSHSGSQDDEDRSGYWIVRNQWSTYWGMNGYAYVAMGENTCGILNNMIQVYTKK